ncbi:MAG: hypothetical protein ACREEW_15465 [Caulobacteraceae bacterium]
MPDISHWWGEDLQVSATGDLALADGVELGEQRVLRRLLTNGGDYIWNVAYGAGLPGKVGALLDAPAIKSAVRSQLFQESQVARVPAPVITVRQGASPGTFYVSIAYADASSGQQANVSFDLSP